MAAELVTIEASDTFCLGGSWIPQSRTSTLTKDHAKLKGVNGDWDSFSATFNTIEDVTIPYKFNAIAGLGGDLPNVGEVKGGYLITGIEISTTYNDFPTITVTGHQHAENEHTVNNQYAVPADMITLLTGAVGAYDFAGETDEDSCVTDSSYSLGVDHIDAECNEGNHFVGQSIGGIETLTCNYVGTISSIPAIALWTITSYSYDDSNEDFDKSSVTAERIVLRE